VELQAIRSGMAPGRDDHGFKRSSGVDYSLVQDRQIDDHRFERQRAIRAASAAVWGRLGFK
jgi:hypothetical protein